MVAPDRGARRVEDGRHAIEASSGKTRRHRLNRGGDRLANAALHRIAITRLRRDQRTRDYIDQRTRDGKTRREAIRCLKRYIARGIYNLIDPSLLDEHRGIRVWRCTSRSKRDTTSKWTDNSI
jgi:hypothetical protein